MCGWSEFSHFLMNRITLLILFINLLKTRSVIGPESDETFPWLQLIPVDKKIKITTKIQVIGVMTEDGKVFYVAGLPG